MTDLSGWDRHDIATMPAVRVERTELADLVASHPDHEIWAETPAGLAGAVKYVAKRRPGTLAHPYIVVCHDLEEFQAALRHA